MPTLRVLSGKEIASAISMREAIDLMRDGFEALSSGRANVPIRMNMPLGEHGERGIVHAGLLRKSFASRPEDGERKSSKS